MSKALTIALSVSFSSLVAQVKNCGQEQTPTAAYEAFAQAASEGDCEAVYEGLDLTSRARLTAGLESLLSLAVAAQDHDEMLAEAEAEREAAAEAAEKAAEPERKPGGIAVEGLNGKAMNLPLPGLAPKPEPEPTAAPTGMPADPWEEAEGGEDDAREQVKRALVAKYHKGRKRAEANKRRKLKKLKGKKLFLTMCNSDKPPPLMTLFLERGVTSFAKQPIASERVSGDTAELEIEVPGAEDKPKAKKKKKSKKAKKKSKDDEGEADEQEGAPEGPPPVRMVREDEVWRLSLEDLEVDWRRQQDGRWLPLLSSSVIAVAVETNLTYSPSRAYTRIRQYIRDQDCSAFYDHVDAASKRQVEHVAPMVVGLTSALDADAEAPGNGKELLLSLCESAPYQGMQLAGLLLGPPASEQIEGSRATVTIRPLKRERGKREPKPATVTMVREDGKWKLHIDTLERTSPFWQQQAQKRKAAAAATEAEKQAAKDKKASGDGERDSDADPDAEREDDQAESESEPEFESGENGDGDGAAEPEEGDSASPAGQEPSADGRDRTGGPAPT